jgi:prophage antirepressor-like protein
MTISKVQNFTPYCFENVSIDSFTDLEFTAWFHGFQVCKILGFSNPTVSIPQHTDDDERQKIDIGTLNDAWFISEAGLYGMIFASKKPEAKKFKRWVKHHVLPSIRRDGGYISPDASSEQLSAMRVRISELEEKLALADSIIDTDHKLRYSDHSGLVSFTDNVRDRLDDSIAKQTNTTATEWLKLTIPEPHVRLKSLFHRKLSELYRMTYEHDPEKHRYFVNGRIRNSVINNYKLPKDLPLLQKALEDAIRKCESDGTPLSQ